MKKIVASALIVFFCASSALSAEPPQIAFKLLSGYVEENSDAKGINGTAVGVIAVGLCLLGGATVLWIGGDSIASSLGYGYIPSSIRDSIALSFTAAGGVVTGVGIISSIVLPPEPIPFFKAVFEEPDPELREIFAVAAIKSLAEKQFAERISAGAGYLAVPIVSVAATVLINTLIFRSPFYILLPEVGAVNAPAVAAASVLFFTPSKEETLLMQYLEAKAGLGEIGITPAN